MQVHNDILNTVLKGGAMISLLNNLTMADKQFFGNKAVCLGELSKLGIKVPNGFAISTEVFSEFLDYNRFKFKTDDYLSQNENIIDSILKGSFPQGIKDSLEHYFNALNVGEKKKSYIVRSSAVCEDSDYYSMAGIFSSFDNIYSFDELIESIKKCYASLFSDKSLSIASRYGIPMTDLNMGIIVQRFVVGNPSGIAFSVDAVKMDPDVIVVNSVKSICADYVDGKYPSSQYRISKAFGKVIDSFIPPQTPKLTVNEIDKLHKEVLFIEKFFGIPQDIEWTMEESNLHILQARPVTTYRSRNYPEDWFTFNSNDTLVLFEDKALKPLLQDIKAVWYNSTCKGWEYSSKGRNGRFKICSGYFYNAVDERDWDKRTKFREWIEALYSEGKNIFQDFQLPQIVSLRNELNDLLNQELTAGVLENIFTKSIILFELSTEYNMSAVDGGIIPLEAFERYCSSIGAGITKDDFYDLVYGISKLSEERHAVIELALLVKSNTELMSLFDMYPYDEILYYHLKSYSGGRTLMQRIGEYIKEYGMFSVNGQWQFDSPIILEQPWRLIGKIRACIHIDSELFLNSRQASLNNKKMVVQKLTANMGSEEMCEFLARLKGAEKAFLVNDDHCFYLDLSAVGYLRLALAKVANLLKNTGVIENSKDIDFLKFEEITNLLRMIQGCSFDFEYKDVIRKRKNDYHSQSLIIPPSYIGTPPVLKRSEENKKTDTEPMILKGISGLQKKVTGKVKVIADNNNIHLDEDAILVLKHGHSCYFLPFIDKIKRLIYDGDSPYDHPGIIARELSIPSLYNTQNATSVLRDGDEVELDGINGCVILI